MDAEQEGRKGDPDHQSRPGANLDQRKAQRPFNLPSVPPPPPSDPWLHSAQVSSSKPTEPPAPIMSPGLLWASSVGTWTSGSSLVGT
ncbi:hypothetical protein P7K49_032563 [Saguinus oedipus]|uniref:Uncharacterized protein n=1 Tax=Saguinus oedipus TaxID=9490 RepID=A0ABQ9TYK8_SAGOE|nr:hypothetical protein P7K49_032563 [Saguinus oedipus]